MIQKRPTDGSGSLSPSVLAAIAKLVEELNDSAEGSELTQPEPVQVDWDCPENDPLLANDHLFARRGFKEDRWKSGREYFLKGLTCWSEWRDAVYCIGFYLYFGDKSLGLNALGKKDANGREYKLCEWIEKNHDAFSKEFDRDKEKVFKYIEGTAHWKRRRRRPGQPRGRYAKVNVPRKRTALNKVRYWAERLKDEGVRSARALNKISGVSREALSKPEYQLLWRPLVNVRKATQRRRKTASIVLTANAPTTSARI